MTDIYTHESDDNSEVRNYYKCNFNLIKLFCSYWQKKMVIK